MKKTSIFFALLFIFLFMTNESQARARPDCGSCQYQVGNDECQNSVKNRKRRFPVKRKTCQYPVRNDECTKRSMGRFNPYYYVYNGYFHSYNWRITPLTVDRLLGPQAFFGPTS